MITSKERYIDVYLHGAGKLFFYIAIRHLLLCVSKYNRTFRL